MTAIHAITPTYSPSITAAEPTDFPIITDIWESSVRSTHHFLDPEDITFYRSFVAGGALQSLEVYCISIQGEICGFLGMTENRLEMLFVAPNHFNKGLGKILLRYAITKGVDTVEVNEQNHMAFLFYQKAGFQIIERKPLDGFGKDYPILVLKLTDSNTPYNHLNNES
jgi:putative acetyltransferase